MTDACCWVARHGEAWRGVGKCLWGETRPKWVERYPEEKDDLP